MAVATRCTTYLHSGAFLELTSDATKNPMLIAVDKITQITVTSAGPNKDKVRIFTVDGDLGMVVVESMRMIKSRLKKVGVQIG